MKRALSRRSFLRGVGATGTLVGLPLLSSLDVRADETAFPKRLVLLYNPNGTLTDHFWPTPGANERDFTLNTILSPLEPFKDRIMPLRGVDLSVTGVGPGGPHQRGVGALFTGSELQEGEMIGGDGSRAGWANGQSIDQRIVEHHGAVTQLPSLELGVRAVEPEVRGRVIYKGPANPLPPILDPAEVFKALFANLSSDEQAIARRKRVLQAVQDQFKTLQGRVSRDDEDKLEAHVELVRDVERRLEIPTAGPSACGHDYTPVAVEPDDENDMPMVSKLMIDLLAIAFSCDLTRVASIQYSTAINALRYPWLESMGSGHTLSHSGDTNTEAQAELLTRATWQAEQVAYLMSALDAIPEGEGSVLDNTIILWGNEISVGNTHSLQDIPFLLAGGAGGYFDMGRYLQFDGVPHNQLLVSILNAMGVDTTCHGNAEFCSGPLAGLEV